MTAKKVTITIIKTLIPILIMGLIFYFSAEAGEESSGRSAVIAEFLGIPELIIRKMAHFFLYGMLGTSWWFVFRSNRRLSPKLKIALPILLTLLYATFDELHQYFIPGRVGAFTDVLLDTAAGITFVAVLAIIDNRIKSRQK